MKIAITGTTTGIGKSFADNLSKRGHEIIGISRTSGQNIKNILETSSIIEPCDMFINNAREDFAQTELLYFIWKKWKGQKKYIWNISTIMAQFPISVMIDDDDDVDLNLYRNQKLSLDDASRQLSFKSKWPLISLLRPGTVSIKNEKLIKDMEKYYTKEELKQLLNVDINDKSGGHTPDEWTNSIIDIFNANNNIYISEISLSYIEPKDKINI